MQKRTKNAKNEQIILRTLTQKLKIEMQKLA